MKKCTSLSRLSMFALICWSGIAATISANGPSQYASPYSVTFTHPRHELISDLERGERANPNNESSVPHHEWDSKQVKERFGSWGPPARHYPSPEGVFNKPASWQRERVIATALKFQGYDYQHHHIPDWLPPRGWPWKEVRSGQHGKGIDCSNFTSFVYNLGFGIKPDGGIKEQASKLVLEGPGGKSIRAEKISRPASYQEFCSALRTGDLIYVKHKSDPEISHVIIWVGPIGKAPDNAPLIIDSHGEGVVDAKGQSIPPGVQLRPFHENSWYFQSSSHAHRIIPGN